MDSANTVPVDWLTIGKVTGVHGLAGNLKVWSFADSIDTFAKGKRVRLVEAGKTAGQDFTIAKASAHKKGILLVLKTVSTREASEALVGKEILMDKADLPELAADTWYWDDLEGLEVKDTKLGSLGTIDHIFPTAADDILVVKGDQGKEILIPLNTHFVANVDMEAEQITTCLPPGFILE